MAKKSGKASSKEGKTKKEPPKSAEDDMKQFLKAYLAASTARNCEPMKLVEAGATLHRAIIHPDLVQLDKGGVTVTHLEAIFDAVVSSNYMAMHALQLWNVKLGDHAAVAVANFLLRSQCLQTLEMADCGLGVDGCNTLGEVIDRSPSLESINLEHNHIGDLGVAKLVACLPGKSAISSLNLSYCEFGSDGAKALADRLFSVQTLTALDLSGNFNFGAVGVSAILDATAGHPCVRRLGLSGTGFGIEQKVHTSLTNCIKQSQCTHYDLRGNHMGDSQAYTYAQLLKSESGSHVTHFAVSDLLDPGVLKLVTAAAEGNKKGSKKGSKKKGKKKKS